MYMNARFYRILLLVFSLWASQLAPQTLEAKTSSAKAPTESSEDKQARSLCDQASQLRQSSQLQEAADKYHQVLAQAPDNAAALLGLGQCLYDMKRYYSALEPLDRAVTLSPMLADAWLYRARTFENMSKFEPAIADYKHYVSMVKDNDEKTKYSTLIDLLQAQANSKNSNSKPVATGHNYLAEVTASGLNRWPGKTCLLSYYVEAPDAVPGYKAEYDESLRQAFSEWADSAGGKIDFKRVYAPVEPGIVVTWTDDLHAPALMAEAGYTQYESDGNGIKKAHIQLLTVSPFKGEPLTNYLLHNVCLHEIGHALGLSGHSPDQNDIMYPSCFLQTGISPNDRTTLALLYADDQDQAAKQAQTTALPHRKFTTAENAQKLMEEGTKMSMSGDFTGSIEKLKEALKLDPKLAVARKNLAVSANNLAIGAENAADQKLAAQFFRQAIYYDPAQDIYKQNLNSLLLSQGRDPKSFDVRLKEAKLCESDHDSIGAQVEYEQACELKKDPLIVKHLAELKAASGAADASRKK